MATEQRSTKEASWKELQSLRGHFKDLEFHEYGLLNEDCKREFMDCLDGQSIIRIGMCSKNERRLAAGIPLKISVITIEHCERLGGKEEIVRVELKGGSQRGLHFKQCDDGVEVHESRGRLLWKHANIEYFKEAVEFFEFLLKKCHYRVDKIGLEMGAKALDWAARDESPIKGFRDLRIAELGRMDSTHQKYWLKKLPDHLEYLRPRFTVTSEVLELSQIRTARQLIVHHCDVTGAQLLELKAVVVYIDVAPLLTARGVNAFFKRWQLGGGVDGFKSLVIGHIAQIGGGFRVEDVLEGLDALEVKEVQRKYFSIRNKVRANEELRFYNGYHHVYAVSVAEQFNKIAH